MATVSDYFPIGAVVAHAGDLPESDNWLLCDGREFTVSDYPELFTAIDFTYGGAPKEQRFKIPDYRGYFMRGTSYGSGVDPDANSRQSLVPPEEGVKPSGDAVGTYQDFATKRPDNAFTGDAPHLPTSNYRTHGETRTGYAGDSGSLTLNTCTGGGDGDTRPINIYVNYYIRAK